MSQCAQDTTAHVAGVSASAGREPYSAGTRYASTLSPEGRGQRTVPPPAGHKGKATGLSESPQDKERSRSLTSATVMSRFAEIWDS